MTQNADINSWNHENVQLDGTMWGVVVVIRSFQVRVETPAICLNDSRHNVGLNPQTTFIWHDTSGGIYLHKGNTIYPKYPQAILVHSVDTENVQPFPHLQQNIPQSSTGTEKDSRLVHRTDEGFTDTNSHPQERWLQCCGCSIKTYCQCTHCGEMFCILIMLNRVVFTMEFHMWEVTNPKLW